jgi:pimeloyl-ACP methyl ester carboxylesterase
VQGTAGSPDGLSIAFDTEGAGSPALVFVHGWSCDRSYWSAQLRHFAPRHQVVAIDLAGHGQSDAGRAEYTMPSYGRDVAAVADRLGLNSMVLVGHSMGGDVNLEAAAELGSRVVGHVWVDVYFSLGRPRSASEVEGFLGPLRGDFVGETTRLVQTMFLPEADTALASWVVSDMASAPSEVAINEAGHSISNQEALLQRLATNSVPIVAINFDWRPTDAQSLAVYGIRTVRMPGVGHFGMMEDPARFNRMLDEVIASFA